MTSRIRPRTPPSSLITKNCGNCHDENLKCYTETYHGQVNLLGFAYTAKCFDCHGSHAIKRVDDPTSMVHPDNRLKTCQKCHPNATAGLCDVPAARQHARSRPLSVHLAGVEIHAGAARRHLCVLLDAFGAVVLPGYRDRKQNKYAAACRSPTSSHGNRQKYLPALAGDLADRASDLRHQPDDAGAHRHDGCSMPTVSGRPISVKLLGGPQNAAFIHRICASVFVFVFVAHLIYMVVRSARNGGPSTCSGPIR